MLRVQILASVFGLCVAVALHMGLARLLPTEQFALYGLALAVQHFGMIFQDGGFRMLVLREETRRTPGFSLSPHELRRFAVGHAGLISALAMLLVLVVSGTRDFTVLMLLAIAGGLAKTITSLVSSVLFARAAYLAEARWQTAGRVAGLVAAIVCALVLLPTASGVFAALLVAQVLLLLPAWHGVNILPSRPRFDGRVYRVALPLASVSLLTALYFRTGAFFLYRHDPGLVALAHFSLGHRLLDAAIFVMAPAAQMLFVHLRAGTSFAWQPNKLAYGIGGYVCLTVLAMLLARSVGGPVVVALAGAAYADVAELLPWFALALCIAMPNFLLMQAHLAKNHDHVILRSALLAALGGLIANALLVPPFGALGAVAALVVSEILQLTSLSASPWWTPSDASVRADADPRDENRT